MKIPKRMRDIGSTSGWLPPDSITGHGTPRRRRTPHFAGRARPASAPSCHRRAMRWKGLLVVLFAAGCSGSAASAGSPAATLVPVEVPVRTPDRAPEREDFEAATPGSLPPRWAITRPAKDVVFAAPREGAGMVLQIVATTDGYAKIKRPLDVARYRGKRVLISARGRLQEGSWRADDLIGVDVSRPGPRGYADRVRLDRLDDREWQDYRVVADVAADATGLDLVITATNASKAQVDDIALTVIGQAGAGDQPPEALAGRALDNVGAFARLYEIGRASWRERG